MLNVLLHHKRNFVLNEYSSLKLAGSLSLLKQSWEKHLWMTHFFFFQVTFSLYGRKALNLSLFFLLSLFLITTFVTKKVFLRNSVKTFKQCGIGWFLSSWITLHIIIIATCLFKNEENSYFDLFCWWWKTGSCFQIAGFGWIIYCQKSWDVI